MSDQNAARLSLSEINAGELKEIQVGETPVLLARVGDECFALGAYCTHYGAPLADGALIGDKIICPWHHACFNARNGNMIEPPAIDSLPQYPLRIENGVIHIDLDGVEGDRRIPDMIKEDPADTRKFVIIGGGGAGYMAAQTLREEGFAGKIVMITREDRLPYDRPNLSKDYLFGQAEPEWMPLRSEEFFAEHDIDRIVGKTVTGVDIAGKKVSFDDGSDMAFDRLLVATGGAPRKLKLPGADLGHIHTLRSFGSADDIIASIDGAKKAAVIGASFIAMEAAAALKKRGLDVTVIAPDKVPFERTLGLEIGAVFQKIHEDNGVKFRLGNGVAGFEGDPNVSSVILASGEKVEADVVITGIGVVPETSFLSGVELHPDHGVFVDENMRIADDVYAAGDIVHFRDQRTGQTMRIEHWRTALQQGRVAARNMAGKAAKYHAVPFFWTTEFDSTLNYLGRAAGWDEIIFKGKPETQEFLAFFVKDGLVTAVASMNRDKELAYLEGLFLSDKVPTPDEIRRDDFDVFGISQ